MKSKTITLSFLFMLILSSLALVNAQISVNLTISSDKSLYYKYDTINLAGTLSFNGISPSDGLVGIQVQYPTGGIPLILRTVKTGATQVLNQPEKISSALSSDLSGNAVESFVTGSNGYFTVTVKNQDNQIHSTILSICLFDGNGIPLGLSYSTLVIGAMATQTSTVSIPIPSTAHSGTAYGYANVYSALPKDGGIPLAEEQSFQFTISGGKPSSGSGPSASGDSGVYSISFRLPKDSQVGTYAVYAASSYSGLKTTATTNFKVNGILGDFNGDSSVDGNDLFTFAGAYVEYYQGQAFNTMCDINQDSRVDSSDFFLFLAAYIQYWSS